MNRKLKIGIQNVHQDELNALMDVLSFPEVEFYTWRVHSFDKEQLLSCDLLVLFARRHWHYLKFEKPYILILADYVSDQKAINLSMSRRLSLTGYRYTPNSFFKAYLCGSLELYDVIKNVGIESYFYVKKYPFSSIFSEQQKKMEGKPEPKEIVSLINNYQSTASERKWSKPENSFFVFQNIAKNVERFHVRYFGAPHNQISFEESNDVQASARYTIHIKYWGHVCNAVVKSLALGTPVIMDKVTFEKGRYAAYVRSGKNGLVFNSKDEIITFLNGPEEESVWRKLKSNCLNEASNWHLPYAGKIKEEMLEFLNGLNK